MSSAVSRNIQSTIQSLLHDWLEGHPLVSFLVSHPILATILLIVVILSVWSVIQMIPFIVARIWLFIFKSPFLLSKSIFKYTPPPKVISANFPPQQEKFFKEILSKLETIEAKQNELEKQILQLKK